MSPALSTESFFDEYAGDFNAIYGNDNTFVNRLINRYFRESMRLRYVKTLEACTPLEGKRIVDIGCGPGHYGITLAKRGAEHIYALDFARSMIDLARRNAEAAGVQDRFTFAYGDFITHTFPERFDHAVVMGFMDYIQHPEIVIEKTLSITEGQALFSFPVDGGLLAWQRKLRYKRRCDLYMYRHEQLERLFEKSGCRSYTIEPIGRDFFVKAVAG